MKGGGWRRGESWIHEVLNAGTCGRVRIFPVKKPLAGVERLLGETRVSYVRMSGNALGPQLTN
jgi:hypothetical protein